MSRLRFVDPIEEAQRKRKQADAGLLDLFDEHPDLVTSNGAGPTLYTKEEIAEKAFEYFRERGFPYRKLPVHISMQELNALAKCDSLLTTTLGYHVADTYHPHRFHGHARKMKSPYDSFQIDKLLRRSIGNKLKYFGVIGTEYFSDMHMVSGTQVCANFRPGVACYYYRKFCKQDYRVLDACTGYGGRLLGFMASGMAGEYVGIDPSVPTYKGNKRMVRALGFADKAWLINKPAEDVELSELGGKVDFCFTSPPYFAKEEYDDADTQSFKRYPEAKAWKRGFLEPFLKLQFDALKHNKFAVINIADVKFGNHVVPLTKWVVELAEKIGFEHRDTEDLVLSGHRFGSGGEGKEGEQALEPVFIFYKP